MSRTITIERPIFKWFRRTDGTEVKVPTTETEHWIGDDYYCPYCAMRSVYVEAGEGDFYVGPRYICASCAGMFTLQSGAYDDESKGRGALIRTAVEVPSG